MKIQIRHRENTSHRARSQGSALLLAAVRCLPCAVVLLLAAASAAPAAEPARVVHEAFERDPDWDGHRNRLVSPRPLRVKQDFGYRATNRAGGARAGEIGGIVQRAPTPAYYALPIEPKSLDDRLSASGTLAVPSAEGGSGVMVGWFAAPPPSWRTPNSVAFRIDGNGGKFWMFYEYGTGQWRTGGGGAFEGDAYQRTSTLPFPADGKPHHWALDYDPHAADGLGVLTFRIDDREYSATLAEGHRQDATRLDHFGIWNVQTPGSALELYLDDLVVDGRAFHFDNDPEWDATGNTAEFDEKMIRPYHDFGHSLSRHAGGTRGEIGGIVFRDEEPAYYAARTAPLSLDDELRASGRLALLRAYSDSGVYIGWFNSGTKAANHTPEYEERQKQYLGILVEGPSRVGHYFRPGYSTQDGSGANAGETSAGGRNWPVLFPDGSRHQWKLHYQPEEAGGRGRITLTLDGHTDVFDLAPGDRARGAQFDRFGIFNLQAGGHAVEIYLDDLEYTK